MTFLKVFQFIRYNVHALAILMGMGCLIGERGTFRFNELYFDSIQWNNYIQYNISDARQLASFQSHNDLTCILHKFLRTQ